ncbi:hypothetical protein FWK35_00018920 [Aphis craccivora]|uniref:Uncharacterized protein n=1 Tax=Aphis craccivora TaxID=307492 RepID=A0A6G0YFF8_APHCR|nr:hypothetical protein FWK35_00018920 [Aphis craccivora]
MSVPQKSLSIEPTIPTIFKCAYFSRSDLLICEVCNNSSRRLDHSCLNRLAPVREPSPPMTTKFVIPRLTRLQAAFTRPARSLKSIHRAEPITVPPLCIIDDTEDQLASSMLSPPSTIPW